MTAEALVQTLVEIYGRVGDFHITPCDGAIPVSEADRLAEKAVEDYTNAALSEERAAIVAWLLECMELYISRGLDTYVALEDIAHNIERGEHHGAPPE